MLADILLLRCHYLSQERHADYCRHAMPCLLRFLYYHTLMPPLMLRCQPQRQAAYIIDSAGYSCFMLNIAAAR